jgi:hypothetical protein
MSRWPSSRGVVPIRCRADLASTPCLISGRPLLDKPAQTIHRASIPSNISKSFARSRRYGTCKRLRLDAVHVPPQMGAMWWFELHPSTWRGSSWRGARGARRRAMCSYKVTSAALKWLTIFLHFTGGLIDKRLLFWTFG